MSTETFPLHPLGHLRHWLLTGPHETLYKGPPGEENVLRRDALDKTRVEPPFTAALGTPGPFGTPWRFHHPGQNFFVELSSFWFQLTLIDSYAFTQLESPRDETVDALLWVAGAADLWVNGTHLTRFDPIRYMYPDAQKVALPLRRGMNTLCVRLQCFGVRDTRILFGLQLPAGRDDLRVHLPGPTDTIAPLIAAANWLDSVRALNNAQSGNLESPEIEEQIQLNYEKHEDEPLNPIYPREIGRLYTQISRFANAIPWFEMAFQAGGEVDSSLKNLINDSRLKAGENSDVVISSTPSPFAAEIHLGKKSIPWPAGESRVDLAKEHPFQLSVSITAAEQTLKRNFEIPANQPLPQPPKPGADFQRAQLARVAATSFSSARDGRGFIGIPALTSRRLLGLTHADDAPAFAHALARTDSREDCADFTLAMLLRLHALNLVSPQETAGIKRTALAFRYWSDEPGNDAMCFWSENHSLLFHGCQRIAGLLFPDDTFTTSGRTGAQQAALALDMCRKWLDHVEPRGFDEFLSSVYMPITILALLNLVDFAQDADVSRRAAALIDRIYRDLATQAFRGVTVGPQGRVYRAVLYPERSGTQLLLTFATPEAVAPPEDGWDTANWFIFLASSPAYRPPKDLADLMREPANQRYRHANAEIVLHKTRDYLLTSLAIPAAWQNDKGEPVGLQPGWGGYQQHVWQATLAPGCHVFVNHPGGSFDESKSRPGYWYGNGLLPRVTQRGGALAAIYAIPDGRAPYPRRSSAEWFWPIGGCPVPFDLHPIPFTHAHWPADAFDRQEVREHWAFGQKDSGYVALWCSALLEPHDDVLTGRELRAAGHRTAWLAFCGSAEANGTFDAFIAACLNHQPAFDPDSLTLSGINLPA